ncbi:hypothetical protein LSH36_654g00032 [Paralvinella palmiformis]|uniref:Uncharacterized protein n=1 Tax=Paralvinella palmiformis TaxID=53620 RepID=A0AAD9J480_9ANNE|nr:hypothetical protein LSH36_654g00032 [Paralvinella palmiformis]
MNLHSTHQTSDVCLFELVPPSPDGYFTRARSFSNGSPSRGVKSRDHSEPVSKAGSRLRLYFKETFSRIQRSRSFSEFTDISPEMTSDSTNIDTSSPKALAVSANIDFAEIDRVIEGHRKQLAESQKQILNHSATEQMSPVYWLQTVSGSESCESSDSDDSCCPLVCNCGARRSRRGEIRGHIKVKYIPVSSVAGTSERRLPPIDHAPSRFSYRNLDSDYFSRLLYCDGDVAASNVTSARQPRDKYAICEPEIPDPIQESLLDNDVSLSLAPNQEASPSCLDSSRTAFRRAEKSNHRPNSDGGIRNIVQDVNSGVATDRREDS